MEIKELVPKSKEIIIQPKIQEGTFYDAFSYIIQGQNKNGNNENGKGYLFIVSQIHSNDPSLDYVPNLIASFIKRELESGNNPINGGNEALENSLKKTNELLESLLKNNADIKFDIGVALINKEKLAVSKIGKSKIFLARPQQNEIFDVFENISQFSKSQIDNKRFSNLITGEIKKDDKFFFFTPNNRLSLKQKAITSTLIKSGQEDFLNSIHVPCCGIYFEIKEESKKIAEAPIKENAPAINNKDGDLQIVATEVSKINRSDAFKRTAEKIKEMVVGENTTEKQWRLAKAGRVNNYLVVAVIGLVIVTGLVLFTRRDSKLKEEISMISEKIRVSESRFLLKQNYEARQFLNEAFQRISLIKENDEKNEVLTAAISLLNRIEKVDSSLKPSQVLNLSGSGINDPSRLKNIFFSNGIVFVNDSEKIYAAGENELKPLDYSFTNINLSWPKEEKLIIYGSNIEIVNTENSKITELRKKFSFEPLEMKNYEDNLYFLGSNNIYKITNALVNPVEELEWLKTGEAGKIDGNFVSFDLDSNIYVITDQRKLGVLFKGELSKSIDLSFEVKPGAELFNLGGDELLIVDKETKLARVVDLSGEIKVSYDLSEIDQIKDAFFDKESKTLYLLSPAKIWKLSLGA